MFSRAYVSFFFVLLTLFFSFHLITGAVDPNQGLLKQTVISPLGTVIDEKEAFYFAGESAPPGTFTQITSRFSDFGFNYDPQSFAVRAEPYCRIGGDYKITISNEVNPPGATTSSSATLFSCKTTRELIQQVKIPSTWADDDLILYCNDGGLIHLAGIHSELFTSQLNVYKACIVKNVDLQSDNTLVFGYDSGNTQLDAVVGMGQLVSQLDFVQNTTIGGQPASEYTDDQGTYYVRYESSTGFFTMSQTPDTLGTSITSVFTLPSDFALSRVALFKSLESGKKAYGYEYALEERGTPIYKISLDDFTFFQTDCFEALSSYGADQKDVVDQADSVVCLPTHDVLINSVATDSKFGDGVAFNLFKNVLFDLQEE